MLIDAYSKNPKIFFKNYQTETNESAFYQRDDSHRPHNPEVAGSSPAAATMSSVHNATEHSYVKEQSKDCSFAISMGQSAPVERLSGRSLSFTRPYRQDTQ